MSPTTHNHFSFYSYSRKKKNSTIDAWLQKLSVLLCSITGWLCLFYLLSLYTLCILYVVCSSLMLCSSAVRLPLWPYHFISGSFWLQAKETYKPLCHSILLQNKREGPLSVTAEIQRAWKGWATVVYQKTLPKSNQVLVLDESTLREGWARQQADCMWHDRVLNEPNSTIIASINSLFVHVRWWWKLSCSNKRAFKDKLNKNSHEVQQSLVHSVCTPFPDSPSPSGLYLFRSGMLK